MAGRRTLGIAVGIAMAALTACASAGPPTGGHATAPKRPSVPSAIAWVGTAGSATGMPGSVAGVPDGGVAAGFGSTVAVEEGGHWHWATFPASVQVDRAVFTSPTDGLLYAEQIGTTQTAEQVYQTRNGGRTWRLVEQSAPDTWPFPVDRITVVDGMFYDVSAPGWTFLLQTLDDMVSRDGLHWTRWTGLPGPFVPTAVTGGPGGRVWMAGLWATGGALVSGTPGHWTVVLRTSLPVYDIAFFGSRAIAVGGVAGIKGSASPTASRAVYASTDAGRTWSLLMMRAGVQAPFSRVFMPTPQVVYALAGTVETGANGPGYDALWRSDDGGATWTPVLTAALAGAWATSAANVVVETRNGVLWQTGDAGTTWVPVVPEQLPVLWAAFASPQQGFAAVDTGLGYLLLQTGDGGSTWSVLRSMGSSTPLWWFSPRQGILVTASGTVEWTFGAQQQPQPFPDGGAYPDSVAFLSPRRGWMVTNGSLLMTRDGGAHWATVREPLADPSAVAAAPGNRVAVVDATGHWAWTEGTDRQWHTGTLPGPAAGMETLAWTPTGTLWFAGWWEAQDGNSVGRLWVVVPGRSTEVLSTQVMPQGLGFTSAQDGWAYTFEGDLFLTHDGGHIWHRIPLHIVGSLLQRGPAPSE